MTRYRKLLAYFSGSVATALLGAVALVPSSPAAAAPCQGPGAPTTTQTKCIAVMTTGQPLTSYDISFVNPDRAEYYLGDRSTSGIDIFDTERLKFKRTIGGFRGVVLNKAGTAVDNAHSGPAGVTNHGRWLYGGDGDSTLHVIDLNAPTATATKQILNTGGTTRVDEMALTTDGKLLLAANNAEDPPFATLFKANGDNADECGRPDHQDNGRSHDHRARDLASRSSSRPGIPRPSASTLRSRRSPTTRRGATPTQVGAVTCDGGLLVTDPAKPIAVQGAYNSTTKTGVISLTVCGPNGATVGLHDNLLLGCTPGNNADNKTTLVINAKTHNTAHVDNITGSDEVWFNKGDNRYYLGASKQPKPAGSPLGSGAVLGVVDGTSVLIETIPQSSGSHSVAADSKRNLIFVPQTYTAAATAIPAPDVNTTAGRRQPDRGPVDLRQYRRLYRRL